MAPTMYSPLPAEDGEAYRDKFRFNHRKIRSCIWEYISQLYIVALHFTVITLAALLFLVPLNQYTQPSKLLPSEIRRQFISDLWGSYTDYRLTAFAKDAVRYETTIFDPSGFSEGPGPATPFEGVPSPENNAMWDSLTNGWSLNVQEIELTNRRQ